MVSGTWHSAIDLVNVGFLVFFFFTPIRKENEKFEFTEMNTSMHLDSLAP